MVSGWSPFRNKTRRKSEPEAERETTKPKSEIERETVVEAGPETKHKGVGERGRREAEKEREEGKADRKSEPERVQLGLEQKQHGTKETKEESTARLQLYRRDDVRRFAGWLLKGHEDIRPQLNRETGEYACSGAEFGLEDISALLAELESHRILQRHIVDTVPGCSACGHSNFQVIYLCPFSQHSTLELGTLIEHYACGYTDFEYKFRFGNELLCPKCRRMLKMIGSDYRKVEHSYRCTGCGKIFGKPKLQFPCRFCGKTNFEDEMVMRPIYGYQLNKGIRGELITHCGLETKVIGLFKEYGFEVTAPTTLQGLSGVLNNFDLGAKKGGAEIVLDMISATNEVSPQDIVAFFAKIYDSKPPKAFLIAIPRTSREAQRLAAMYGVEVIAAEEPDQIIKKLESLLGPRPSVVQEELIVEQMPSRTERARSITKKDLPQQSPLGTAQEPLLVKQGEQKILELEQESPLAEGEQAELGTSDEIIRSARARMAWVMHEMERRASS